MAIHGSFHSMTDYLECIRLNKAFGALPVLKDVTINVSRGECLVLLGPSGCGKTTLLNLIAGTLSADSGTLRCDGQVLDDPVERRHVAMRHRGFAMVFQEFSLWPHMSAGENVAFGLKLRGVNKTERQRQTMEALRQVRMENYSDRMPAQLSGGQQQRVAIARALVVRPRILLLDEPLSALDARLRDALKEEIASLIRETGITAVYVTHDQSEAFSIGHRVAVMNGGRLEQCSAPEDLYREPRTLFVASFIGSTNLLPYKREGEMLKFGNRWEIRCPNGSHPKPGTMIVRRECVRIGDNGDPSNPTGIPWVRWQGRCRRHQFLGDRHEVLVDLGDGMHLRGFSNGRIPENEEVPVWFSINDVRFLSGN